MDWYFSSPLAGSFLVPWLVFFAVFLPALPAVLVADFFLAAMSLLTLET